MARRRPSATDQTGSRVKWKTVIIPFSTLQFWVNFLIVLAVLCAVLIGLYYQFLSPKAQARRMIAGTEERFEQAIVMGVKELAFEEYRAVQDGLFQARKNYDERKYTEALILLEQTGTSLDKALERLRSDEFFRRERAAAFKHVSGDVEVQPAGSLGWQPAKRGMKLKKGDRVRTRSGSKAVVQFDDGSQLTVKSDSLVHIDELSEDVRTRTKNSAINLLVSDVEASILRPTAKGSRFIIRTPGSTAEVNKARMNIRVDKDNQTEYKLISGDVSVNAGGKDVRLGSNEVVRLASEGRVLSRGRLLGVPEPRSPANLDWRVSGREAVPVTFSWDRVPEAAAYHLVVATDRYFANAVYDNAKVRGTGATVGDLTAGIYYWRVSSVDGQGRESLYSPFAVFRFVHDQTPPLLAMSDPIVIREGARSKVYLAGAIEPGSTLTVNGIPAPLAPDGTFRMFSDLASGTTALTIRAADPAGNVMKQVRELR